jgi:hypothetical protein
MLPLLLPSDPKLLSATSGRVPALEPANPRTPLLTPLFERKIIPQDDSSVLSWKARGKALREVDPEMLQRIDGPRRRPRQWINFDTETVMPSPIEGRHLIPGESDQADGRPTRRRSTRRSELEKAVPGPLSGDTAEPSPGPPIAETEVVVPV